MSKYYDNLDSLIKGYILLIFKDGKVVEYKLWLSSYYKDEELPQDVIDWLTQNGFDQMPIYTDSSSFVSRDDYDWILGYDAVGRLEEQMSCVDNPIKVFSCIFKKSCNITI